MRTLLQEVWLPGGLGTGACGGPHTAGGLGLLGGLGSETDDSVDTVEDRGGGPSFGSLGAPGPGGGGEAKDRALALSTDWHPLEMAGVPDCPSEMALSVCTPVLQFLRVCGGWPMGPTQP